MPAGIAPPTVAMCRTLFAARPKSISLSACPVSSLQTDDKAA